MGERIEIGNEEDLKSGLKRAAEIILAGGAVAFPTESFYGLAVNAMNEEAIRKLFLIKERKSEHPVLILIPFIEVIKEYATHISETARLLMEHFWPGGLTLIFEAGPGISPLLTASTGKIGVRLSSHPIATGLAMAVGVPITGTSANISGRPPYANAEEVFHALGSRLDLILDGGATGGGSGSTILDVTIDPPKVIREGMVEREQIRGCLSLSSL